MLISKQTQNKLNISRILHLIWKEQGISRSDIARRLSLDKSTITDATQKLLETGVIEEWKQGESKPRGGRRPTYLRIKNGFGIVVGIEFRPESYRAVFCDLRGDILHSFSGVQEVQSGTITPALSDLITNLCSQAQNLNLPVIAIGIGLTGIVDVRKGRILYSIPFQIYEPQNLAEQLIEIHHLPILIENDANACAWAELNNSDYNNHANFLALLGEIPPAIPLEETTHVDAFSVGIGLAFGRRVYHGTDNFAGEFRSIFWAGETEGQFSVSKADLTRFASDSRVREQIFSELARQIALLVNTLNLNGIFICGGMERYSSEFIPLLDHYIKENWSYEMSIARDLPLLNSSYGDLAVAVGSAAVILDTLFGIPDYHHEDGGLSGRIRDLILGHMARS
ncbi:ROK family transcriptional regulator [Spirochaeta lutea]|uniref:HTH marR-type domain-containing protein n=1 Tax=Spirochaeta lutea TaxID=1480694 RepID=A0A098QXL2_9SPIO|nr:ROK family transcriptional regulator [Spirochaeta lutea]KGE71212.1 hypothetical protein DC28_12205 [Spirochaeta lutea]